MKAKDKAWQLLQTIESVYIMDVNYDPNKTKQCALICVDEILEIHPISTARDEFEVMFINYWEEVKQEINKL